ncbi:hypothetical protein OC842_005507 [Tilletia horrida]|uniref:CHK kinase-like domain-containing protein n=1 Tax=Tilletia horrida TaxID=155126 RepID=A0AAN6JID2_9BASI|nr:hypothetical protein OC842_005507 [Tilletia horrida]
MREAEYRRVVEDALQSTDATVTVTVTRVSEIAELWAGYGSICAVTLQNKKDDDSSTAPQELILKVIRPPPSASSNGAGSSASSRIDEGHLRKLLSYRVEANFYSSALARSLLSSAVCAPHAAISKCHAVLNASFPYIQREGEGGRSPSGKPSSTQAILLDDIRTVGFPYLAEEMRETLDDEQTKAALRWLAHFHAHFAGYQPSEPTDECPPPLDVASSTQGWSGHGVWQVGGYSYTATRLTELSKIAPSSPWAKLGLNGDLAHAIDWALTPSGSACRAAGQTLIHGDVKSANLAFSADGTRAAAYDFQFVGRGVGVTDLAKFLTTSVASSVLRSEESERDWLRFYHGHFIAAVQAEPEPEWTRAGAAAGADTSQRLLASRRAAGEYTFENLLEHWDLAVLSWQRFQAGWGAWGNTRWTQARARAILERPGWSEALLRRWRARDTDR